MDQHDQDLQCHKHTEDRDVVSRQPLRQINVEVRPPVLRIFRHHVGQRAVPGVQQDQHDFAAEQYYGQKELEIKSTDESQIERGKIGRGHDEPDEGMDGFEDSQHGSLVICECVSAVAASIPPRWDCTTRTRRHPDTMQEDGEFRVMSSGPPW